MNLVLGILLPPSDRSVMDHAVMSITGWRSNASLAGSYFTPIDWAYDSTTGGWKGTGEP